MNRDSNRDSNRDRGELGLGVAAGSVSRPFFFCDPARVSSSVLMEGAKKYRLRPLQAASSID
jgi:hypothetical protein